MQDSFDLFVPGRLCLFGEHSDWAGAQRAFNADIVPGEAIVTGIQQGIYATVRKHEHFVLTSAMPGEENMRLECPMSVNKLKEIAREGKWFSYVAGVASYVKENYQVAGLEIRITGRTLPIKRGLSSSAAICVLVAKAFNRMYGLQMSTKGEMQTAYFGEQRTPSRCGRLDQACAFGIQPVHMIFDGNEIDAALLIPRNELYFVIADLMTTKNTIKILADLNRSFPFPQTNLDYTLHDALGKDNRDIVTRARKLIENGDAPALGALMKEAQRLFDLKVAPVCPEELTAPVLHGVLADPAIAAMTYGGKGVGSQGDGTVQFLAKDKDSQGQLVKYLQEQLHMDAFELTLMPQYRVKRAIIPVAGFGTRLYPATHFIKKELFPVADSDGFIKPVILILLEELERAGIEKICLVINGEEDRLAYDGFFKTPLPEEKAQKLPEKLRGYQELILRIGKKIEYAVQKEKRGFGHAVYQCRQFADDKPVLLLLGDTIYRSRNNSSCTEQLLAAFEQTQKTTLSIHPVQLDTVIHYGILTGKWIDQDNKIMIVKEMVEKPSVEYAGSFLGTRTGEDKPQYFSVFGEYVLTPEVFNILERNISENSAASSEIQLTDALNEVGKTSGLYGYAADGEMFDVGIPQAYMETVTKFAGKSKM
jgi:UTP-glucose-1-phosphate uridylyltransferase/mevalonate kinase